ncbi:hypothetical protein FO519_008628 [Halicephalobus sp. NKZ332]|nr:hypothetical protein FO519_008628 [Halicephalobus sp. NKZ332]
MGKPHPRDLAFLITRVSQPGKFMSCLAPRLSAPFAQSLSHTERAQERDREKALCSAGTRTRLEKNFLSVQCSMGSAARARPLSNALLRGLSLLQSRATEAQYSSGAKNAVLKDVGVQMDHVDLIFRRSLLLSKLFTQSWGSPKLLGQIFHFRKNYMGKGLVPELLERKMPKMIITKDWERKGIHYIEGQFRSPLYEYCPELFPAKVEICHFRGLFPSDERKRKGLVVHLAGTGDHTFFRREYGLCHQLLEEGYSGILVENPFYGSRKPSGQFSSSLLNVSDLFVMGGSLMAECGFLLRWAKENGHETLGLSGISMGGYMASLAASNVHEPIALVPCLSWTTAAPVYTEGALSEAIPWAILEKELKDPNYRKKLREIKDCSWLDMLESDMFDRHTAPGKKFMWILMEEFTNLSNFPVPFEPSLVKAVIAEEDAYVIRNDVPDLTDIWPGAHVKLVPGVGHVLAYLRNHGLFRKAISETMEATAKLKGESGSC